MLSVGRCVLDVEINESEMRPAVTPRASSGSQSWRLGIPDVDPLHPGISGIRNVRAGFDFTALKSLDRAYLHRLPFLSQLSS
jgi:hypothetical protein